MSSSRRSATRLRSVVSVMNPHRPRLSRHPSLLAAGLSQSILRREIALELDRVVPVAGDTLAVVLVKGVDPARARRVLPGDSRDGAPLVIHVHVAAPRVGLEQTGGGQLRQHLEARLVHATVGRGLMQDSGDLVHFADTEAALVGRRRTAAREGRREPGQGRDGASRIPAQEQGQPAREGDGEDDAAGCEQRRFPQHAVDGRHRHARGHCPSAHGGPAVRRVQALALETRRPVRSERALAAPFSQVGRGGLAHPPSIVEGASDDVPVLVEERHGRIGRDGIGLQEAQPRRGVELREEHILDPLPTRDGNPDEGPELSGAGPLEKPRDDGPASPDGLLQRRPVDSLAEQRPEGPPHVEDLSPRGLRENDGLPALFLITHPPGAGVENCEVLRVQRRRPGEDLEHPHASEQLPVEGDGHALDTLAESQVLRRLLRLPQNARDERGKRHERKEGGRGEEEKIRADLHGTRVEAATQAGIEPAPVESAKAGSR